MKDYHFYLWIAYLSTGAIFLINLLTPLIRHYKLFKKKRDLRSLMLKK
jgi:heme exporter protein CcmD